ncbi:MAG: RAMP superfamily CRISPR-associated protein [bacterium]|nr:RAMP superfamily CRISPR-associated protein [bacterium]
MSKSEIRVAFETITPLWTGDAWRDNTEIRPSSLIGSLRFWFEVICYFGGICKKEEFNNEKGRFEKDIKNDEIRKKLLTSGTDFNGQVQALKELGVPIPAIVFGTTGWRSLIEINEIKLIEDFYFGNRLKIPHKFCFNKNNKDEVKEENDCPKRSDNNFSVFYFKIPYFWGKIEVVFRVHNEIKDSIFLPLLTFMDKYGYWGGGWNIGYGRLKVLSVNSQNGNWEEKDKFDFSKFGINKTLTITESYEKIPDKNLLKEKVFKIRYWRKNCESINTNIKEMLKDLILEKANLRIRENNRKDRHYVFGKTGNIQNEDLPQGSKILPYINKINSSYECGLLSIVGILSLY